MTTETKLQKWMTQKFGILIAKTIADAVPKAIAQHIDKLGKAHDFAINWKERAQVLELRNKELEETNVRLLRQLAALRQSMEAGSLQMISEAITVALHKIK